MTGTEAKKRKRKPPQHDENAKHKKCSKPRKKKQGEPEQPVSEAKVKPKVSDSTDLTTSHVEPAVPETATTTEPTYDFPLSQAARYIPVFGKRTGSSRRQKQATPASTDGEKREDKEHTDADTHHTETSASGDTQCTEHDTSEPMDDVLSLEEKLSHTESEGHTAKAVENHQVTGGRYSPLFEVNEDTSDDKNKACDMAMQEQPGLIQENPEAVLDKTDTTKEQPETGQETSEIEQGMPHVVQELEEAVKVRSGIVKGKLEVVQEKPELVQETTELVRETVECEDETSETVNKKFESVQKVQDEPEQVQDNPASVQEEIKPSHVKFTPAEVNHKVVQEELELAQEKLVQEVEPELVQQPELNPELAQKERELAQDEMQLSQLKCEPVREKSEPMQDGSNANECKEIAGKTGCVNVAQPDNQLLGVSELSLGGKETSGSVQEELSTVAVRSEVLCTTPPSKKQTEALSSVTMTTSTTSILHSNELAQIGEARTKTVADCVTVVTTDLGARVDDMSELTDSQLCQFIDDDMPISSNACVPTRPDAGAAHHRLNARGSLVTKSTVNPSKVMDGTAEIRRVVAELTNINKMLLQRRRDIEIIKRQRQKRQQRV